MDRREGIPEVSRGATSWDNALLLGSGGGLSGRALGRNEAGEEKGAREFTNYCLPLKYHENMHLACGSVSSKESLDKETLELMEVCW